MQTINAIPEISGEWLTTAETAKLLGRHERTVQEMAKDGRIRSKPAGRPEQPKQRLYDAADVKRLIMGAPIRSEPRKPNPSRDPAAVVLRTPKPSQGERALDTVSIVGNLIVGHKAELEMFVKQSAQSLETVVTLILSAQKAEADANRERIKAEREDNRERWELDRKDRLERRKSRVNIPQARIGKTRKARA